jgi:hypothetical protein
MPDASSSSDDMGSWRHFARRLPVRLLTCWPLKLTLGIALGTLFTAAYLLIGHYPLLPVRVLPFTWPDRVTGFHPIPWVWVYQSVYLPMNLVPWLSERREELRRYVRGFILLSIVSFAVFILVPTRARNRSWATRKVCIGCCSCTTLPTTRCRHCTSGCWFTLSRLADESLRVKRLAE